MGFETELVDPLPGFLQHPPAEQCFNMHSPNRTEQREEPIAIIGIACRFPGGANTPSKLRDLIHSPHDLSRTVPTTRFDTKSFFHSELSHHGTTNADKAYFLDDDVSHFDAPFFNVQATEADAIDPQQRLLMEVVYESLYEPPICTQPHME